MDDTSESENTISTSGTETGGVGSILYAGIFLGIGFILLFDTTTNLMSLYDGYVNSPIGLWIRVLFTAILGSTFALASLSVVLDSTHS